MGDQFNDKFAQTERLLGTFNWIFLIFKSIFDRWLARIRLRSLNDTDWGRSNINLMLNYLLLVLYILDFWPQSDKNDGLLIQSTPVSCLLSHNKSAGILSYRFHYPSCR